MLLTKEDGTAGEALAGGGPVGQDLAAGCGDRDERQERSERHLPAIRPVGPPPLGKNRAENLRAMDDLICALQTPRFNTVFVNPPLTNRATLKYAFSHVFQGPKYFNHAHARPSVPDHQALAALRIQPGE